MSLWYCLSFICTFLPEEFPVALIAALSQLTEAYQHRLTYGIKSAVSGHLNHQSQSSSCNNNSFSLNLQHSEEFFNSQLNMNFHKIFIFVALILAISLGQSEAGWLKKIGKKIERIGQHTRDATIQGLGIAQQAANVAATARG
ncbi:hypothetical protein ACLKA6_002233 [Drosophila palustris]